MKKLGVVFTAILMVIFVSGCTKTTKLTCEGVYPGTNMEAATKAVYYFEDNKLVKSNIDVTFQNITVDGLESVWESFKTQFTEQNEPTEVDGYKREVSYNDKKYTFTVSIDLDYAKLTDEVREEYGVADYQGKTLEEIKELVTADDVMTCK